MLDDTVRLLHEIKTVTLARADTARRAAISLRAIAADADRRSLGPAATAYVAEEELAALRHLLQLMLETRNEAIAQTLAETVNLLKQGLLVPLDPGPAFREFLQADELAALRHLLRLVAAMSGQAAPLSVVHAIEQLKAGLPAPLNARGPFRRLLEEDELAAVRHLLQLLADGDGSESATLEALGRLMDSLPVPLNPSPADRTYLCADADRAVRNLALRTAGAPSDSRAHTAVQSVSRLRDGCVSPA